VRLVESILSYRSSGPFINTIPIYAWSKWRQPVRLIGDSKYSSPKWKQHYCRTLTQLVLPTAHKQSIQVCNGSENQLLLNNCLFYKNSQIYTPESYKK
jgi:hypothetical protein